MINCTVICDKCKDDLDPETATFKVRGDNQLSEQLRKRHFKWTEKPGGGKVLLGPVCRDNLRQTKQEAEAEKTQTISDFFS